MSALARPLLALAALACATGCGADLTSSTWVHEPEWARKAVRVAAEAIDAP